MEPTTSTISALTVGEIILMASSAGGGVIIWKMAKILFVSIKKVFNSRMGFTDLLSDTERRKEERREKSDDDTTLLTLGKFLTIHGETCRSNLSPLYTSIGWIEKFIVETKEQNREMGQKIDKFIERMENRVDKIVDSLGNK